MTDEPEEADNAKGESGKASKDKPAQEKSGKAGAKSGRKTATAPAKAAAKKPDAAKEKKAADAAGDNASKGSKEQASEEKKPSDTAPEQSSAADTETDSRPPPVPPRTPMGAAARGLAWVTLVVALVAVVGAVTWPWWSERFAAALPFLAPAEQADPAVADLTGRVEALEEKAENLSEQKSVTLQQLEEERARFQGELKTLMSRLAEVESAVHEARSLIKATEATAQSATASRSLKALSDRLAELEKDDARVEELASRLNRIEKEQGPEGSGPQVAEVKSALDAMRDRVDKLETIGIEVARAESAEAQAIVLAVAQVRDAVYRGAPFAGDLEALSSVAAGRPAIEQAVADLRPHAATGVVTLAALRQRFSDLASDIVAAARADGDEGWVAQAAEKLQSLVKVRRTGEAAPPDSVDALVARVDGLLAAGDLSGAVEAMRTLYGNAGDTAAPWLEAAEIRLAVEKTVANLHVQAVSLLAPAKAGG